MKTVLSLLTILAILTTREAGGAAPQKRAASPSTLSAAAAVSKARQAAGAGWKIALISTTGVTQSVMGQSSTPAQALMRKDGTAGQWVVEFFRDDPTPVVEGTRRGFAYPFSIILVTPSRVSDLPSGTLKATARLKPLPATCENGLDDARRAAIATVKSSFDRLSVASDVRDTGACSWRFRFYDLQSEQMVAKVHVSGDGKKILAW